MGIVWLFALQDLLSIVIEFLELELTSTAWWWKLKWIETELWLVEGRGRGLLKWWEEGGNGWNDWRLTKYEREEGLQEILLLMCNWFTKL